MKRLLLILLCVPLMFSCEFFSKEDSPPTSPPTLSNKDLEGYNRLIEITGSKNAAFEIIEKIITKKELTTKELAIYIEAYEKIDLIGSIVEQDLDALDNTAKVAYKDSSSLLKHFSDEFLDKEFGYNLKETRDSLSNINSVQ